ncbi:MAG: ParB N-terminal domain-containing protein [Crocinitomicaceae bacterium]|nr:ParB N-terminal domain-containing protein [Crocinitomicaceae bacterium]
MNLREINKNHVQFYDNLLDMPVNQLNTEIHFDIINCYSIETLNIDILLRKIQNGNEYKNFVWDSKMKGLFEFIGSGTKLIPPIIRKINEEVWAILDGQHRVGLCIYLGFSEIPFLIRNDQAQHLYQVNTDKTIYGIN